MIPGSTVGIFLEGEDSRGDHGLDRLVEFKFKAPPGTTSSSNFLFFKDLLHRKSVRYTGLQNYKIVPVTNLP